MNCHETLYECSDSSSIEPDPNNLQHGFSLTVQNLGIPMYDELRKVASRCEGGEEALSDLTTCLLKILQKLDGELENNKKMEGRMERTNDEIERLTAQMERQKREQEDLENKTSEVETELEEERRKMMKKMACMERKSADLENLVTELSSTIAQKENEYKYRIKELNIRYQQLQEINRDLVERLEDQHNDSAVEDCNGKVSLASEIQEVIEKQSILADPPFLSTSKLHPPSNSVVEANLNQESVFDDIDPTSDLLSVYNIMIMFTFTTLTILPSVFSTCNDTSWEEIFKSAMDPFFMPPVSMPPI